ncbi:MAG: hypothetical protein P1V51_24605 [Deltaproteobacteria bacterium]|nr:hypothetical protein [Deltaproteobacteria bacterium]
MRTKTNAPFVRTIFAVALSALFAMPALGQTITIEHWEAKLRATDDVSTARFDLGVRANATDDLDILYDIQALAGYGLRAYFDQPTWGGYYSRDMRDPLMPENWSFIVDRLTAGRNVTLTWNMRYVPTGCDRVDLTLVDQATGTRIDMRRQESFTWAQTNTSPRVFLVEAAVISSPRPAAPVAKGARATGDIDRVIIDWTPPKESPVSVAAYDVYRVVDGKRTKVNELPLFNTEFRDRGAPADVDGLVYEVHSLSHDLCSSDSSNRVVVRTDTN